LPDGAPPHERTDVPHGQQRFPAGPESVRRFAGGGQGSGAIGRRHGGSVRRSRDRRCRRCAGHGAVIEGESPLRGLSEATASESNCMNVRTCGMEAVSEPQHRTKVNLQAGRLVWASGPSTVMPNIRSWPDGSGGGRGGTSLCLTPGDLDRSKRSSLWTGSLGRLNEGNDREPMLIEKSDHLVVATKPGNAGGAKGMTS